MKLKIIILLSLTVLLGSCSKILLKLYGVNAAYAVIDDNDLVRLSQKYDIPLEDWYELDFSYYDFIRSFDKDIYIEEMSNHQQPLQALYFNSEGKLISYHVNCDMGGFPNLKWNRNDTFNTFVPETQTTLDTLISLETFSRYMTPTTYSESFSHLNYDYTVVVVWADYMGRQSKRLCDLIRENVNLAQTDKKVKIVYVNVDNFDYMVASKNTE